MGQGAGRQQAQQQPDRQGQVLHPTEVDEVDRLLRRLHPDDAAFADRPVEPGDGCGLVGTGAEAHQDRVRSRHVVARVRPSGSPVVTYAPWPSPSSSDRVGKIPVPTTVSGCGSATPSSSDVVDGVAQAEVETLQVSGAEQDLVVADRRSTGHDRRLEHRALRSARGRWRPPAMPLIWMGMPELPTEMASMVGSWRRADTAGSGRGAFVLVGGDDRVPGRAVQLRRRQQVGEAGREDGGGGERRRCR